MTSRTNQKYQFILSIAGKGDLFGEDIARKMPIRRSNGDVRALTYCDVLYITRERFQEVAQLYQDFSLKFSDKLELTYDLGASEVKKCEKILVI